MPTYRIRCGDMDAKIETPYQADAEALAMRAIEESLPSKPGALIEVNGGQYKGDAAVYFLFSAVAKKLGRMD